MGMGTSGLGKSLVTQTRGRGRRTARKRAVEPDVFVISVEDDWAFMIVVPVVSVVVIVGDVVVVPFDNDVFVVMMTTSESP